MPRERTPRADFSIFSRPLEWIAKAVARFPVATLVLALAAAVASIWLTVTQLGFRTSRAELLSPTSDYNRRWLEYTREFGEKEDVVVVVEGDGRERIAPVLDEVCRALEGRSDLFAAVMHETDAPKLRAKGLYYLPIEKLRRIDSFLEQFTPVLEGNLAALAQVDLSSMAAWSEELSGIGRSPADYSHCTFLDGGAGRLISDDGRMGFVLLKLRERDTQSFAQNSASIAALRRITAEIEARRQGVKIGLTGLPIIEFDEMRSSEKSMTLATIFSFLGVLAVMIVAFGGFRHSIIAMAALVVGMVWACGFVALTIGHLNILSIAFGSILFGLGIDYGVYYVAHYLQHRRRTESTSEALVQTAVGAGPGILTGAVTAAVAFLAAGLTEFPGVAQLGLLAGGGIILCWLAQITVLPALIRLVDADGRKDDLPEPLDLRFWLRPLFAYPRLSMAAAVLLVAATAVGIHHLHFDYNLLNLQPTGLKSVELEHRLFKQTNRSAWFALSVADTPYEVAARRKAFERLPSVEQVVEIASVVPPDAAEKRPIVERIHRRLADLPPDAPPPGASHTRGAPSVDLGKMLAGLRRLREASSPEPPRLDDLPDCVTARFLGKSGKHLLQVYSKANIWDVEPMGRFVAEVRSVDPEATGNPMQVYEASRQMKRSFEEAACYALLIILPVVLLDFRRLDHTLLAALPTGVGMLMTIGLMGLLDIPLNQANMIFLPLVIGIGIEDGIHLLHDMRRRGRGYDGADNAVIVAVVVNSLTTMVGFGALMIANHRGLQSLGRVLTLSMGCCLLTSLLLPNLLRIGKFAADDSAGPAADDSDALVVYPHASTSEDAVSRAA
ncbi:MAG: MMPL family transporter [Pirellulales bacterium]|nr:MMPL family transporter [Pirellulales bacterium]